MDDGINAGTHLTGTPMADKSSSPSLSDKLASDIVRKLVDEGAPPEFHLVKQTLAKDFNVSRSPVQTALEKLTAEGIVVQLPRRGFFLKADEATLNNWLLRNAGPTPESDLSFRMLTDHVNHRLSAEFSENELARVYGLTRGQVSAALRELLQEGWVERKQGYGWAFLPVVNSLHSSAQSYRFRQTIECAALLDEEYEPDLKILVQLRNEQERLLDGMLYRLDNAALFQIGSHFHESLASCCKNPFYYDSLLRVNRLRKLYEKHSRIDVANFEELCREHIALTVLLERDDRAAASALLRQHLGNVLTMKQARTPADENENVGGSAEGKLLLHF